MNKQQEYWAGRFGNNWASNRNTRDLAYNAWERDAQTKLINLLGEFFTNIAYTSSICEFGCNDGFVLKTLQDIGFHELHGVDINQLACDNARKNLPDASIVHSSLEDFHCLDQFTVVMTSAMLIHVHPDNLENAMTSLYNNSKRYIFGRELSSHLPKETDIAEWKGQYWHRRFLEKWLSMYNLKVVKYELIPMQSRKDIHTEVYLLEKPGQTNP